MRNAAAVSAESHDLSPVTRALTSAAALLSSKGMPIIIELRAATDRPVAAGWNPADARLCDMEQKTPVLMKSSMRLTLSDALIAHAAMMKVAIKAMPAGRYRSNAWLTDEDTARPAAIPAVNVNAMATVGYARMR